MTDIVIPPFRSALERYLEEFDPEAGQLAGMLPLLMQVGISPPMLAVKGNPLERTTTEVVCTCHSFMRRDTREIWLMLSIPGLELWIPLQGLPSTRGVTP